MTGTTLHNIVLVLLGGLVVGYLVDRVRQGQVALARALAVEAATRERERLARSIHDGVLQVLALVQRRGAEIGGPAAELGRLAGEQEASLRALVRSSPDLLGGGTSPPGTGTDLPALLTPLASSRVTVAAPPVLLPPDAATEIAAAVGAALDNVAQHAGRDARAWVLLEQERDEGRDMVLVTVRDDGAGLSAHRLAEAAAEGRLGVAQCMQGRLRDLGGDHGHLGAWRGHGGGVPAAAARGTLGSLTSGAAEPTSEGRARRRARPMTVGDRIRVLVVDDHPMRREAVARDLDEAGYEVCATAANGAEAAPPGTSSSPRRGRSCSRRCVVPPPMSRCSRPAWPDWSSGSIAGLPPSLP